MDYETNPAFTLQRADGSVVRLHRHKTKPYCYLPREDDKTVTDWNDFLSRSSSGLGRKPPPV
jgi:hypothetical protein